MLRTTAVCTKIEKSDSGHVSFVRFKPSQKFEFREGQFMFLEIPWRLKKNGKVLKNAYSIATTNQFLQQKGEIGFIVKKASDDGVSHFLTQEVAIGYEIMMTGPLGHFVDHHKAKNYLMISIWSGVTPIFSLYDHLINEGQEFGKIANLFGERYADDVLWSIEELFHHKTEHIQNYLCLSREEEKNGSCPSGRHTWYVQTQLESALKFLWDANDIHVFLCGKPAMCDDVQTELLAKWFTKEQLTIEKY